MAETIPISGWGFTSSMLTPPARWSFIGTLTSIESRTQKINIRQETQPLFVNVIAREGKQAELPASRKVDSTARLHYRTEPCTGVHENGRRGPAKVK